MTRRVLARHHHACRDSGRKHEGHFSRFLAEPLKWTVVSIAHPAEGSIFRAFRACSPTVSQRETSFPECLVTMPKPMGLYGPHPLTTLGVAAAVTTKSPGAYALGKMGDDGIFYIDYVGRSDDDLPGRLQKHVPERYPQFYYGYLPSAKAAYEKECALYHDFNPPDNKIHPATPPNTSYSCPQGCGR